jgi:hypothetical protein
MHDRIHDFAKSIGADVVAELPQVGHGALGAVHYAAFYRRRLEELRQRGVNEAEAQSLPINLDDKTLESLRIISSMLWPDSNVAVGQLAAGLLKGISVLILDQLIKQLEAEQSVAKKALDAKAALVAALKDMLNTTADRQAAG